MNSVLIMFLVEFGLCFGMFVCVNFCLVVYYVCVVCASCFWIGVLLIGLFMFMLGWLVIVGCLC